MLPNESVSNATFPLFYSLDFPKSRERRSYGSHMGSLTDYEVITMVPSWVLSSYTSISYIIDP